MLSQEATEALLVICFLAMVFGLIALLIPWKSCVHRQSTPTSLIHEDNNLRLAPEGLTGDNLIVRRLPAAYRPRERARHEVYPRPSGWRPTTLRSTTPAPFDTYPDLERGSTAQDSGDPSQPTASPPVVPGGHHVFMLAQAAGDSDHFVQTGDVPRGPSAAPYWEYELVEVPSYEAVAASDREGARSVRILGGVERGR
ncbi:hypothetical protein H2200_012395 [Cladophialophora chaetospira]|uniref:Uncharacterized protein n=1 Tax=Cladophialophora chaetospira TaxID=386627 RepID=A0AA38WXR9_9EURO|nr:hypothetical protein H2200_012395 [Cladophialophora chaetospira]